mmetsp:Transcript_11155/g.22236  ORF Transcript_11155/g.22236 Transcript_11155/m.22236 type:complete len:149 (+) Transcript_11155:1683-2129(+)
MPVVIHSALSDLEFVGSIVRIDPPPPPPKRCKASQSSAQSSACHQPQPAATAERAHKNGSVSSVSSSSSSSSVSGGSVSAGLKLRGGEVLCKLVGGAFARVPLSHLASGRIKLAPSDYPAPVSGGAHGWGIGVGGAEGGQIEINAEAN